MRRAMAGTAVSLLLVHCIATSGEPGIEIPANQQNRSLCGFE